MFQQDDLLKPMIENLKYEDRGLLLIHLLIASAEHVAADQFDKAMPYLKRISHLTSPDGDIIQRMIGYFSQALADRMLQHSLLQQNSCGSLGTSLVPEDIQVTKLFFQLCPFLKLSYMITNQAIVQAVEGEDRVHIIDLNAIEPAQWINLLQKLSKRPNGPPHLRITGIHEQKEVLTLMETKLKEEAKMLNVPFQFDPVVSRLEILDTGSLNIIPGEAIAVSSVLQLHSLLATDEEVLMKNMQRGVFQGTGKQLTFREWLEIDMVNAETASEAPTVTPLKIDNFLSSLWKLSPKLLVITEQEANHNGFTLMERLKAALKYYAALFYCLEVTVSRASTERRKVEQALFGEEITNIVACEGIKRTERHEKLDKWNARLEFAGFEAVPLGYNSRVLANKLLERYSNGYKIKEEQGCYIISWENKPLFSVSAWASQKGSSDVRP